MTMRFTVADPDDTSRVEAARVQTLGRLLPGALHELANPLLALGGTLDLLLEDAAPGTKTAERLALLRRTTDEIAELVRLLQRLGREQFEPEREIELALFVVETTEIARRFSRVVNADLDVRAEGEASVRARPAVIRQVLLAAMLDALEAAPPGARVEVQVDGEIVRVAGAALAL